MKNAGGYTLIETLVSIMILSVMLLGGMTLLHRSDEQRYKLDHKRFAVQMANETMEKYKEDHSTLPSAGTPAVSEFKIGEVSFQQVVNVTDIDENSNGVTDYKQVDLSVSWTNVGTTTARNFSLTTYISL